jgi:iron(III) transport system ATP-binding protein
MTSVTVEKLVVRYETTEVLKGIDVTITDGEFFFLLGPSGCGKTTLLRTIAGFIDPAAGNIWFGDRAMSGVPAAKRDCGMVFQNYALWPHLTVAENVAFGLDVRKIEKTEKRRRVGEALALVRMAEFADRLPGKLSGGQQQRVALARAIVVEPQLLLLDEPLSNLDAKLRVELRSEIREIQQRTKRTAIYVTHDRAEALALADRMAILRGGVVEQMGSPRDIYDRPENAFVAGFVGDVNTLPTGRIVEDSGESLDIEGPWGRLGARPCGRAQVPRDRASVLLRPERLRIEPGGSPGRNRLAGRVTRSTFLGEVMQYEVALDDARIHVLALSAA